MGRILSACVALLALHSAAATVEVAGTSLGMGTVKWSEESADGGMVALSLEAEAEGGCAFAGWTVDGSEPKWGIDVRLPSASGVLVSSNAVVRANFVEGAEDTLLFDFADSLSKLVCGEGVSVPLDVESASYPELKFSGLPAGLSFDRNTLTVSGVPGTPCMNTVTVTGRNGSGYTFTQVFHSSVGDLSSERMTSRLVEIPVGEYYHEDFESLFSCSAERMSTSLAGVPPGMTWNEGWGLLYGTPTDSGVYVLKATVRFADGRSEVATARMKVSAPNPAEHGVDLSELSSLSVGDQLETEDVDIGTFADGEGIVRVSGLPTGLSVETRMDGGVRHFDVVGMVRSPGLFTVKVDVAESVEGVLTNIVAEQEIVVADTPDNYLKVSVSDLSPAGGGTVSGGGAIPVAYSASVSAKASNGYVFAGWLDSEGEIADVGDGIDYRAPSITYGTDTQFDTMELFALFVPGDEDSVVMIDSVDGTEFDFSADDVLDESFDVYSASLPTLSAKGLPAGVTVVPSSGRAYSFAYDPDALSARPAPGRYAVTLTARNASGALDSATFVLKVSNVTDRRVKVKDDYGEFVPDEKIAPIDLSGAVDFGRGETLSVSGLPRGLSYNRSANERNGIAANTITGTPTAPGYYTLTFTAKVVASESTNALGRVSYSYETAVATAYLRVLPHPLVAIYVDDEAADAGNSVSGSGNYRPGTKITLKAKAAKGWVFAGWDGDFDAEGLDLLNPSLAIVTGDDDSDVYANFVPVSEDMLAISAPPDAESGFAAEFERGMDVQDGDDVSLLADLVESVSYPTVKVTGLPPGIKFSSSTLQLSGSPSRPGVYYVTVSAKNAGGYTFTRILRIAVYEPGDALPEESVQNDAGIDFSALDDIVTGEFYGEGDLSFEIGPSPQSGARPAKASVSGIPAGLDAQVSQTESGLAVSFVGTPSKVSRYDVSVKVTYADKTTLASRAVVIPVDGGSGYLSVVSLDESLGTVSGGGVYAAGATVKISAKAKAKCVFAGWLADVGSGEGTPFEPLADKDGHDLRSASVSFPFRPGDFDGVELLAASFAPSSDDSDLQLYLAGQRWEIDPASPSEFAFSVESLSLPKVTAKNLPKGVSVDAARGLLVYTPSPSAKSGTYAASLSAQNQSRASGTAFFEIVVANRCSGAFPGLRHETDAYDAVRCGVAFDPGLVDCTPSNGWTVKAAGLPPGLKFSQDKATGECRIAGVATKAGVYTVVFTASKKGSAVEVATITLRVEALPAWAVGTFNGALSSGGVVQTLAIDANGKLSGKMLEGGDTWTLSATSFDSAEGQESEIPTPVFRATALAKSGKAVVTNEIAVLEQNGIGVISGWADSEPSEPPAWVAYQNLWKRADAKASQPVFKKGFDAFLANGLKLTFKKDGAVSFAGTVDGAKLSGSSQLVNDGSGWKVTVYSPPKGASGGLCETCAVALTTDDANAVTAVEVAESGE